MPRSFEWDDEKARRNIAKHGVSFQLASRVWDDPMHVIVPDRVEEGEERWHAIGMVGPIVILLVVHVYRNEGDGERIRIVGARKATKAERKRYEEEAQ